MPTLPTVSTLMDAVMNELRIPVSNLTERTKIQSVMSYVYGDICAKQDWWWLVKKYPFVLSGGSFITDNPGITITLTQFTATAVLSSAPVGTSLGKRALWFTSGDGTASDVYRVGSTYAFVDTTVPLDTIYGGPSASGVSFDARMDQIFTSPSDMAKVLRITRYGSPVDMQKIGIEEMSRIKQWDKSVGPPQMWSVYDHQTTGDPSTDRIIWVHPYPDNNYRIEVWYKHQTAGDLSDLDLPIDFQQVLVYGTLARTYTIFLNDTERGAFFTSLFNDVMALMAAAQREYASDHPGVSPQPFGYRRTNRRFATSLGRYFDTYPYNP